MRESLREVDLLPSTLFLGLVPFSFLSCELSPFQRMLKVAGHVLIGVLILLAGFQYSKIGSGSG
ncbi:MAG: hypothetical protein ACJ07L_17300, partial [Opitutales bacterium]